MYEALVARVRYHIQKASFMGLKDAESTLLLAEAADAIEELIPFKKHVEKETVLLDKAEELLNALKPRWIPVTERLPEMGKEVLVSDKHKGVNIAWIVGCFSKDGASFEWACESDGWIDDQLPITHWMPLPEPPEEET